LKKNSKCVKEDEYFYFDPMSKNIESISKNKLKEELEKKTPIGYIAVFQGGEGPDLAPAGAAAVANDPKAPETRPSSLVAPSAPEAPAPAVQAPAPVGAKVVKMPTKRPPSTFTTVQLGAKTYNLPTGKEDNEFRRDLFATLAASQTPSETYKAVLSHLTEDERAILQDTGFIKESFLIKYADRMASFFEALPDCNTDTSVMLNQKCFTSYFLIFALLHSAAQEMGDAFAIGKPIPDLELMKQEAVLSAVQPGDSMLRKFVLNLIRIRTPGHDLQSLVLRKKETKNAKDSAIEEIFTLYY
jgi:hypothetical protein